MRQRNSEILGDEWITLSLVESEHSGSIFPEDAIFPANRRLEDSIGPGDPGDPIDPGDPGDPIDPGDPGNPIDDFRLEDSIDPVDRIHSGDRIRPRDPGLIRDPLTGNPPVNVTPSTVTRLSNPEFRILIDTTRPNEYKVEGRVTVEISQDELQIFAIFPMRLQSTLWGEDSGWNEDDNLFSFTAPRITAPGIYNFSAFVHRGTLNEDNTIFDKRDEVYNKFSIVSGNSFLPSPNIHSRSRTEHGYFG